MFQQTYETEENTDIFDGQQFKQHNRLSPGKSETTCVLYVDGGSSFMLH